MKFRFGSFFANLASNSLTQDRQLRLPNKSGTLVAAEFVATGTLTVRANGNSASTGTYAVVGPWAFVLDSTSQTAGAKTLFRATANGTNLPSFGAGFAEKASSYGYTNTNGVINLIEFEWDGATCWYSISLAKANGTAQFPKVFRSLVGNGSLTSIVFNHNLNNTCPAVSLTRVADGLRCEAQYTHDASGNSTTVAFATAPAPNQYIIQFFG